jgi:8-oxo-dGTP diphosphatase
MKKIVIAVIERAGQFVLVRRRQAEGALHWQFPGGEIENTESESAAAEREVLEEVNIVCKGLNRLGERVHPESNRMIAYWLCAYISGDMIVRDNEELDTAEWVPASEVLNRITSNVFQPLKEYVESKAR